MPTYQDGFRLIALAGVLAGIIQSQDRSRLEEIAAAQEQKASEAQPDRQGKIERAMLRFRELDLLDRSASGFHGFRLKLGGMGTGTGFGIGPEYHRGGVFGGPFNFRASAQSSFRGDRRFDM